jgi:hypothetical protein
MHSFTFSFFLYGLLNLVFIRRIPSVFVSLWTYEWFNSSATIATVLIVYFIFGWLFRALNSIYKLVLFMICVQIFGIIIIITPSTFLISQQFSCSQHKTHLTHQTLLIHCPVRNFLTVRNALSINALEHTEQGEDWAPLNSRVICLE